MNDMTLAGAGATSGAVLAKPREAQVELRIAGMDCPHCPKRIEEVLRGLPGVRAVHVNAARQSAHVAYDPAVVDVAKLLAGIRVAGYSAGAASMRLAIANLHCASCVSRLELALRATPGVLAARANVVTGAVDIEYLPERTDFAAIHAAIESIGYQVAPAVAAATTAPAATADPEEAARLAEYDLLMRKFWFAAAVSLPVMLLSYPDLIPGLREWMPMGSTARRVVWSLLGVVSLPVLVWSGS